MFRREAEGRFKPSMTYYSASCVIVDEVTLDVGKAMSESLLEYFGFSKFKFLPDEKKSKYYIPGTQTEVYGYHPKLKEWVEIATFGLYSPIALSKYGVDKDVMNLGLGVEILAIILAGEDDIRGMVYPQIYKEWELSDRELASMLRINLYPVTEDGRRLMEKIIDVWREHGNEPSPCSFTVYDGEFLGRNVKVEAVEVEENTRLLGPAANNRIFVYDGNILGVPEDEKLDTKLIKEARRKGIDTGITYMDALAAEAAYRIEEMVVTGSDTIRVRSAIARSLSDLNLVLDKVGMRYITSRNKVIDLRGPTFSTIKARIK